MSEPQLTGMAKTFNSVTFTGRANVAKATYAGKFKKKTQNYNTVMDSGVPQTDQYL